MKSISSWASLKTSSAVALRSASGEGAVHLAVAGDLPCDRGSTSAECASTQRSSNTVTVSAWSISGPAALTIRRIEAAFTRIVADRPTKTWSTSNGNPSI